MFEPLLLDIPEELTTARLLVRALRPGDGSMVAVSARESHEALHAWMPWAREPQTDEETEKFMRQSYAHYVLREEFNFAMLQRADGDHVGCLGVHSINWSVPRFEIGYWVRTKYEGQGYVTEAVNVVTDFCFNVLHAERIEIRCDARNTRSAAVAERAGYVLEGRFRRHSRDTKDGLRDTLIFAKVRDESL